LHKCGEHKLLIIDDTVESKRGKYIEDSCKYIWSNKEHRSINALNIVSLNYADSHSTYQRKSEIIQGRNILAIEMRKKALDTRVEADYLLVDSWYAKPNFIKQANDLGMPIIARLPNNKLIWNFKGKHKTLNSIYENLKNIRHKQSGKQRFTCI